MAIRRESEDLQQRGKGATLRLGALVISGVKPSNQQKISNLDVAG